jgi:hypothetical protein
LAKQDPREAVTMKEAAQNPDGTFCPARLLSWYTGMSVEKVKEVAQLIVDKKPMKLETAAFK